MENFIGSFVEIRTRPENKIENGKVTQTRVNWYHGKLIDIKDNFLVIDDVKYTNMLLDKNKVDLIREMTPMRMMQLMSKWNNVEGRLIAERSTMKKKAEQHDNKIKKQWDEFCIKVRTRFNKDVSKPTV